jgi:hypothetical protein
VGADARTRWLGPIGLSKRDADRLYARLNRGADQLPSPAHWMAAGVFVGTVPFAVLALLQSAVPFGTLLRAAWTVPTALGLAALLVLGSASGRVGSACFALGAGLFAHCALAIGLTAAEPAWTAQMLADGPAYWDKTLAWVRTGESPEYELSWWVPAHLQLVVVTVVLSYVSLGITTLHEGLYEIGLMNHYVGNLVREADDPLTALLVGWHPWSVARGIGFLAITVEVVDASLSRLLGRALSTRRQRVLRWGVGLSFVALDALLKLAFLEAVRTAILGALP